MSKKYFERSHQLRHVHDGYTIEKEIVIVQLWVCPKLVLQQSYDNHELFRAMFLGFHVMGYACYCRATLFFIKMVYVGTHDNVFIARQSHDYGRTLSRQPQDSDTTKNRRAKKVHVQFLTHDSAMMLKILCDWCATITDDPRFDKISCIDVSWVHCDQGFWGCLRVG